MGDLQVLGSRDTFGLLRKRHFSNKDLTGGPYRDRYHIASCCGLGAGPTGDRKGQFGGRVVNIRAGN